jgi:hypothetical protein
MQPQRTDASCASRNPSSAGHGPALPLVTDLTVVLTCAKFVTTPQYAPRLRERLCLESQLADDAGERGWEREVDRHERIAERIRALLTELGEPFDPPGGEP